MPEDLPTEVSSPPVHRKPLPTPRAVARTNARTAPHDPDVLREELERHQWRRADVARALGISRSTLWRRMREAGLSK
jgi:transcriptional regulator of acetoin/glycerol metabolism